MFVGGRNGNCCCGQRTIISHDERQSSSTVHHQSIYSAGSSGRPGPRSNVTFSGIRQIVIISRWVCCLLEVDLAFLFPMRLRHRGTNRTVVHGAWHTATTRRTDHHSPRQSDVEKGARSCFGPIGFLSNVVGPPCSPSTGRLDGCYVVREAPLGLFCGNFVSRADCYRGTSLPCAAWVVGWKTRDETRAASKVSSKGHC
jgi:hypothetical protein